MTLGAFRTPVPDPCQNGPGTTVAHGHWWHLEIGADLRLTWQLPGAKRPRNEQVGDVSTVSRSKASGTTTCSRKVQQLR
jgi:hypothetical protein